VLEENPPPSLKSVYSRFSLTESIVIRASQNCAGKLDAASAYQRQQAQGRRDEVRPEIREIVRMLHAQGIAPQYRV
jgi:hypothetical protein